MNAQKKSDYLNTLIEKVNAVKEGHKNKADWIKAREEKMIIAPIQKKIDFILLKMKNSTRGKQHSGVFGVA